MEFDVLFLQSSWLPSTKLITGKKIAKTKTKPQTHLEEHFFICQTVFYQKAMITSSLALIFRDGKCVSDDRHKKKIQISKNDNET